MVTPFQVLPNFYSVFEVVFQQIGEVFYFLDNITCGNSRNKILQIVMKMPILLAVQDDIGDGVSYSMFLWSRRNMVFSQ